MNKINEDVIGYLNGYALPKEFELNDKIDYETMWEKSFMSPIEDIVEVLNWDCRDRKVLSLF
jgi:hypothetical protein